MRAVVVTAMAVLRVSPTLTVIPVKVGNTTGAAVPVKVKESTSILVSPVIAEVGTVREAVCPFG